MEPSSKQTSQDDITSCLNSIQLHVQSSITQIVPTDLTVLLIGDTGEGKSALLNFIASNPLKAEKKKHFSGLIIKAIKPLNDILIGEGAHSFTTKPNKWISPENVVFYDCPGFNDTKGAEQDIINAFYIKRIFDTAKNVKIVIVISENTLQGRADKFIAVLKKLENLLVNIDQILDSISIVLTKANMESPDNFREYLLDEFITNQTSSLTPKQQILMEYFACGDGQIGIFNSPKFQGPIDMKQNASIKQVIDRLNYVIKPQIRITVAPDSLLVLESFVKIISTQIEGICSQAGEEIIKACRKIVDDEMDYEIVQKKLHQICNIVKKIKEINNFQKFIDSFVQFLKNFNGNFKIIESLEANAKLLSFIIEIKPQTEVNHQRWIQNIFSDHFINQFTSEPQVTKSSDELALQIKAFLIGIRKLEQIVTQHGSEKLQRIYLFCFDTFFIDADFIAPGINLFILARVWKIKGDFKISLKGLNAKHYESSAQHAVGTDEKGHGLKGYKGRPGMPGQTGGSFYGKIMSNIPIKGTGGLQIDVRGGDGGNGQNGGNGSDGSDGKDASQRPVLERDKSCLEKREDYGFSQKKTGDQKITALIKAFGTYNSQMLQTYVSKGKKGKNGGSSGNPGAGGFGGYSGVVKLENFEAKVQQGDGNSGNPGKCGIPGKGGKNGKSFQGRYINELMMAGFREEGKIIEEKKEVKEEAKQAVKKTTDVLSVVISPIATVTKGASQAAKGLAGVASLGVGLAAQTVVSAVSASLSSDWLDKEYVDNGFAQNGKLTQELNHKKQVEPEIPFEFKQSSLKNMNNGYLAFRQGFIKSIGYYKYFFE